MLLICYIKAEHKQSAESLRGAWTVAAIVIDLKDEQIQISLCLGLNNNLEASFFALDSMQKLLHKSKLAILQQWTVFTKSIIPNPLNIVNDITYTLIKQFSSFSSGKFNLYLINYYQFKCTKIFSLNYTRIKASPLAK